MRQNQATCAFLNDAEVTRSNCTAEGIPISESTSLRFAAEGIPARGSTSLSLPIYPTGFIGDESLSNVPNFAATALSEYDNNYTTFTVKSWISSYAYISFASA